MPRSKRGRTPSADGADTVNSRATIPRASAAQDSVKLEDTAEGRNTDCPGRPLVEQGRSVPPIPTIVPPFLPSHAMAGLGAVPGAGATSVSGAPSGSTSPASSGGTGNPRQRGATAHPAAIAPSPDCSTASAARCGADATLPFTFASQAPLPTSHGTLLMRVYLCRTTGKEAVAMVSPALAASLGLTQGAPAVPTAPPLTPLVRVHDACATSELFGSLKCDCASQLQSALAAIATAPAPHGGMVVYLQQEGRGIGLANKVAAYALQAHCGSDTVDANRALGLPDDCREYGAVGDVCGDLGVTRLRLITNNPRKVGALQALGLQVVEQVPAHVAGLGGLAASYVASKVARMAHTAPAAPAQPPSAVEEEGSGGAE